MRRAFATVCLAGAFAADATVLVATTGELLAKIAPLKQLEAPDEITAVLATVKENFLSAFVEAQEVENLSELVQQVKDAVMATYEIPEPDAGMLAALAAKFDALLSMVFSRSPSQLNDLVPAKKLEVWLMELDTRSRLRLHQGDSSGSASINTNPGEMLESIVDSLKENTDIVSQLGIPGVDEEFFDNFFSQLLNRLNLHSHGMFKAKRGLPQPPPPPPRPAPQPVPGPRGPLEIQGLFEDMKASFRDGLQSLQEKPETLQSWIDALTSSDRLVAAMELKDKFASELGKLIDSEANIRIPEDVNEFETIASQVLTNLGKLDVIVKNLESRRLSVIPNAIDVVASIKDRVIERSIAAWDKPESATEYLERIQKQLENLKQSVVDDLETSFFEDKMTSINEALVEVADLLEKPVASVESYLTEASPLSILLGQIGVIHEVGPLTALKREILGSI